MGEIKSESQSNSNLEHKPEFWLAFGLVAELVNEDTAEIEAAGVAVCLIQ